ncbi:MAG: prolyl oligopeptidase family serine peptidase [Kiritimatiellae bacterium]|jgi:dipeptidyl aminopeptidase/acylaminoacyl peptidase|nr:prolyl oligopeptidase family serine peptidase [Kiritimatiellia bacterium]
MEKIITYENLRNFTYCNDKLCKGPIKGIVVDFFGLGGQHMFSEDTYTAQQYAEHNIIFVVPYNNPWAWMNKQAVTYTDEILDVLFEQYKLPETTPVVASGGSMGGQSALVYTRYAKRTPVACVANCPVCDMVFHFTERPDLPRTLYSAFFNEEGTMTEALEKHSPLHLAPTMPRVKYHVYHCDEDKAVNIDSHSRKFVAAMTELQQDISFTVVPGKGHCDLGDELYQQFMKNCIDACERA